jgi:cell division septal protein FtsQ
MPKKSWSTKKIKKDNDTKTKIPVKVWVFLFLIIVCLVSIVYMLRLPQYQIKSLVVENNLLTQESEIQDIANGFLNSKYFYIIPQSNIWLYPKNKILKKVKALPSVADATSSFDKQNLSLHIILTEKKHEYVWCGEADCYYMNRDGYIFAQAPSFEGNVFLVFKGLVSGDPLGKSYLPKKDMSEVIGLITSLTNSGLKVVSVNIVSRNEMRLKLDSKAEMIVSMDDNYSDLLKNIKILSSSPDFINASGGLGKIEYIDMRYGKKAFWK